MNAQTEGLRDGEAGELGRSVVEAAPAYTLARNVRTPRDAAENPAAGRRAVIEAVLAEKVLRSYLHNNLQTSFPLVLNLANQSLGEADVLAQIAAAAIQSGSNARSRTQTAELLTSAGATPAAAARFDAALADPRPLPGLVAAIAEMELASHAYAVALLVLQRPSAAEEAFLAYLAARLQLSPDVVVGINRRYRR